MELGAQKSTQHFYKQQHNKKIESDVQKAAEEKAFRKRKVEANHEVLTAQMERQRELKQKENYRDKLFTCTNGGPKQPEVEQAKEWRIQMKKEVAAALTDQMQSKKASE